MFKSMFSKYISVFMAILVICCATIAFVVSLVFSRYTISTKKDFIEMSSTLVVNYITGECEAKDATTFESAINKRFNDVRDYCTAVSPLENELYYMICDPTGLVLVTDRNMPYGYVIDNVEEDTMNIISHSTEMGEITLTGVFSTNHYCYAQSIKGANGEFLGAVIVATSNNSISSMVATFIKIIVLTSAITMIIAFVVIYFVNDRISTPVREMTNAAEKYAKGDFNVKIEETGGKDEVARLTKTFNKMADQLTEVENMRRGFLANVAHDMRTPMTSITGFVDAILDGAIAPEDQEHYLRLVSNETKRLSRLISQLLDISRIEAGDRKFTPEAFDICETAREILISNEQRLDAKRLDVEFDCDDDNMYVMADKDSIHQCLYNICDNAIKFCDEKGKYRIAINNKDGKVHVSVYNAGAGIPPEDIDHVFDRFYKSDKSRGLDRTGVGLGLHIVKTMLTVQGEDIWVESEQGKWCQFTFTLTPCDPPEGVRIRRRTPIDQM